MNQHLWTMIKKELLRVFTDRRLVFTSFILPAVSIAVIYSLMGTMIGKMINEQNEHTPVIYVQHMPEGFQEYVSFIEAVKSINRPLDLRWIDDQDIEPIKEQIRAGEVDLLVVFDKDFTEKLERYQEENTPPAVNTYYNPSEEKSSIARNRVFGPWLEGYREQVIGERLGDVRYATPFLVDTATDNMSLVDEKKATGKGLGMMLPMLITIFLFAGAMGIGMDSIAGEKERGTMATLLVTPIKRQTIAFGKIISLGVIALISAASSFIGILISLPFSSMLFGQGSGEINIGALQFGFSEYAQLGIIMITMTAIFVAVICLLSITAKNVKEAGTYITPIYMLVMIAGFMNMFTTKTPEFWQYLIPVYGNTVAIRSLLAFELTWTYTLACAGTSILTTAILVFLISKMFEDEKVMFSA